MDARLQLWRVSIGREGHKSNRSVHNHEEMNRLEREIAETDGESGG
jgi:hypothetical protein